MAGPVFYDHHEPDDEPPPPSRVHELARLGHDELVRRWFETHPGSNPSLEQAAASLWSDERLIMEIVIMEEQGGERHA